MNTGYNKGLLALAMGTFALGIAEFTMMGVLGDVARSLNITITQAGHMITAYALGVCVGAPLLVVVRRFALRRLLIMLMAVVAVGNLAASFAPGYLSLLCARFVSGLPHGAFFGVGAIVAQRLVPPDKGAESVSAMVGGMTVANLLGVPLSTFVSNILTWRLAFLFVGVMAIATALALRMWVAPLQPLPDSGLKGQFRFLRKAAPWLIFIATFFGQGSVYCWYSYIEPILTGVTGFATSSMTWIMVLAGGGMVAGNFLAGISADRWGAAKTATWIAASVILILPLIYLCADFKFISIVLMVLATAALFGIGGPMQYLIVRHSKGGEMLGGAGIQISFNVSNAVASLLGGLVIQHGFGLTAPALVGIPMAIIATATLLLLQKKERASAES